MKCRGVTKNLKSLCGSERDDNGVLLRNPCFASVYGELLNEEEKTVKRSEDCVLDLKCSGEIESFGQDRGGERSIYESDA